VLIFSSCKVNNSEPELLLRTNVFGETNPEHVESWVFLSNEKGEVITAKNIEEATSAELSEFYGNSGETFTITRFSRATFDQTDGQRIQYALSTYQGVPVGSEFYLNEQEEPQLEQYEVTGTAKVIINGFDTTDEPFFAASFSDDYSIFKTDQVYDSTKIVNGNYETVLTIRAQKLDIHVTTYLNNLPYYMVLEDVKPDTTIFKDISDFIPQQTVSLNKNVSGGYVYGYHQPRLLAHGNELTSGAVWYYSNETDKQSPMNLGYIEGYNYYKVNYQSEGALCCDNTVSFLWLDDHFPEDVQLPDYQFSIIDRSVNNFSYMFDADYTYKEAYIYDQYDDGSLSWSVLSPNGMEIKFPEIPNKIKAEYPDMAEVFKDLQVYSLTFTHERTEPGYMNRLKFNLERGPQPTRFDEFSYRFPLSEEM